MKCIEHEISSSGRVWGCGPGPEPVLTSGGGRNSAAPVITVRRATDSSHVNGQPSMHEAAESKSGSGTDADAESARAEAAPVKAAKDKATANAGKNLRRLPPRRAPVGAEHVAWELCQQLVLHPAPVPRSKRAHGAWVAGLMCRAHQSNVERRASPTLLPGTVRLDEVRNRSNTTLTEKQLAKCFWCYFGDDFYIKSAACTRLGRRQYITHSRQVCCGRAALVALWPLPKF